MRSRELACQPRPTMPLRSPRTSPNRNARCKWKAAIRKHVKRSRLYYYEVQHDEWCGIYTSARLCNCDPVRVLKDDTGRVLARVEGAGFYDPLEHLDLTMGCAS